MKKTKMPAVEAVADEQKLASYELAFHVLPTIAEGEVATVFQGLKDMITTHGGSIIISEEAPGRINLAYEIVKYLEGRNRKFASAYFGWVRFSVNPAEIDNIGGAVKGNNQILRHLLIKLTKAEEAHPFFFHEALEEVDKKIRDIEIEEEIVPEEAIEEVIEVVEESEDKV